MCMSAKKKRRRLTVSGKSDAIDTKRTSFWPVAGLIQHVVGVVFRRHALGAVSFIASPPLSKSTDCCPFDLKSNGEAIVVAGTAACPPDTGAGDWPSSIMRSVLIKAPRSNDSKERWGPGSGRRD